MKNTWDRGLIKRVNKGILVMWLDRGPGKRGPKALPVARDGVPCVIRPHIISSGARAVTGLPGQIPECDGESVIVIHAALKSSGHTVTDCKVRSLD